MKFRYLLVAGLVGLSVSVFSQSKTTESLHKDYDARAFFFYNNTLRMLNQTEDPAFDQLVKNIEKMKFLMIDKAGKNLVYKTVVANYKKEAFEEAMTSRHEGKSFDVYLKEKNNKTTAMLVLINDEKSLMVLDIVGSVALDQVTKLYTTLGESSDIGKRIKEFTNDDDGRRKRDSDDDNKSDDDDDN
jgi:hypothetical protein